MELRCKCGRDHEIRCLGWTLIGCACGQSIETEVRVRCSWSDEDNPDIRTSQAKYLESQAEFQEWWDNVYP